MKEGTDKLFSEFDSDVSQELLLRYITGQATIAEQRKIEEQMADDPFLADAVEGMMKAHDQDKIKADLEAIHSEIQNRQPATIRPLLNWKRALQAAAAILILGTGIWFVNNRLQQSTEKIFTKEFEPYPAPPAMGLPPKEPEAAAEAPIIIPQTKPEPEKTAEPFEKVIAEEKVVKEKAEDVSSGNVTEMAPVTSPAQEEATATDQSMVLESKKNSYATDTLRIQPAPSSQSLSDVDMPAVTNNSIQELSTRKEEVVVSGFSASAAAYQWKQTMQQALRSYDEKNYQAAIELFESLVKQKPSNDTANFYSGVSYLAINDAGKALQRLKKVDNQKQSPYYESALWYESLAYVQMNEKKSAIVTLEKLINFQGEYYQKAQDLLRQLE